MEKRWTILDAEKETVTLLQASLKIHPAICKILVQRGLSDFESAKKFYRPQLTELHNPWLMKDMEKAVERIIVAKNQKEKILVYGDYDVDGTTAVSIMYTFLKKIHSPLDFYIPHRYREGYGISKIGIDFAKENGFTLIISLDCGIKSVELIAYAKTLGIDFIVCDHHLPDDELPAAVAILNAKQSDCPYPYKELCGCGVGFKLMSALAEKLGLPEKDVYDSLDLVATAIAADIVPMTGENRLMAFHGLIKANDNPNKGIKALSTLAGLKKEMRINNLVFMIAPRVNAAGRMDDAKKAVEMFVAETDEEAMAFAEMLNSDNTDRKEADSNITKEALTIIENDPELFFRKTTVLFQPHWHKGVVGIVASRLIENYFRPTIVLTQSGEFAVGSARSVPGFNLYEAIHACREHLLGYGGHFAAAGMTMELSKVAAFSSAFEKVVAETIEPAMLIPEIIIDAEINFEDITWPFYRIVGQMEPFGPENLRPQFLVRNIMDTGYSKIVKEDHLRFVVKQNKISFTGIGFGMAGKFHLMENKKPIDMVFTIEENEWNGDTKLQLMVIDIRAAEK